MGIAADPAVSHFAAAQAAKKSSTSCRSGRGDFAAAQAAKKRLADLKSVEEAFAAAQAAKKLAMRCSS